MNAVVDAAVLAVPTIPGTPFGGGQYVGRLFVVDKPFALITSLKGEGEIERVKWGSTKKNVAAALSYSDGVANTAAMLEAGSPLAKWARELRIGGQDDWHVPSRLEALMQFSELPDQFERDWYWTSTQTTWDAQYAWFQSFLYGYSTINRKSAELRARAVRRIAIQ